MDSRSLEGIVRTLVTSGKGILAADESNPTIEKRFKSIDVASTEESRRAYRDMLLTTPGLEESISGVILFDETIRQASGDGTPFPQLLIARGVVPGIKVDAGAKPLAGHPGEVVTEGLDGLRGRLVEYRELGGRFTKWRAVITIGDGIPTVYCIDANAHALARFAALSQEAELVPIVEPEVLMDGDHTIDRCQEASEQTLQAVFDELFKAEVLLEGLLLKTNMVVSGKDCPQQTGMDEVADRTLECLRRCVPSAVPGIVFLSGGQGDEAATEHLNAMNQRSPQPWELSFSYGRALQAPALKAWAGQEANVEAGQRALYHRAMCNRAARSGIYSKEMEKHIVSS